MELHDLFVTEFSKILVKLNIVSEQEAEAFKQSFANSDQDYFDDFLIEEGLVEESDLLRALSQYYTVPSFDVNGYFFDNFLVRKFPKDFLLRTSSIPLEVDENMLVVVTSRPSAQLEAEIGNYVSYDINFYVGIARDIQDAVKEYYDKAITLDADPENLTSDEERMMQHEALDQEEAAEDVEELSRNESLYSDDDKF